MVLEHVNCLMYSVLQIKAMSSGKLCWRCPLSVRERYIKTTAKEADMREQTEVASAEKTHR